MGDEEEEFEPIREHKLKGLQRAGSVLSFVSSG
jgi:hypothetical protein